MALRFLMGGGNFMFSQGASAPGIWLTNGNFTITASAPAGAGDSFAFLTGGANATFMRTPALGGNFAGLIAGCRMWMPSFTNNTILIAFRDGGGNLQCELRVNAAGELFFTRNGTVIGGTSTFALTPSTWFYLEFKALFSTAGTGTCEVRVNSVAVQTSTGLTNATTTAAATTVDFGAAAAGVFVRDIYALDTAGGANTTYLGDINAVELFPNGSGVHSAWTPNVGPFALTSVNGAGVYQGTITGGASNAYVGYNFNITGFTNGANNLVGGKCTASTATSITFGAAVTVVETHAGSAAFQCIVQEGINQTGTRPNGDVTYLSDATTNDISDFAHAPLALTGIILGVCHQSYLRKDDLGARQVAQVCLSSGSTEQGATISLGNVYQYWQDYIEVDPNTGTQFSLSGLNAASFGIKEIS